MRQFVALRHGMAGRIPCTIGYNAGHFSSMRTPVKQAFAPTALHLNLQRLLVIRVIVFLCQVLALGYAWWALALALDYLSISGIFVLLGLLNAALYLRLRRGRAPGEREFFMHLLLDVAGLSLLLYLSGGANNPFVSYFLVPVTIAAATLGWRYTSVVAVLALLCYTVLLFHYQPLDVLLPEATDEHAAHLQGTAAAAASEDGGSVLNLHIIGMWFNFLVSAALITWFVVKMAEEIRRQQERLSRYREETLRNEQILAIATQSAGTAHELGTPLGTMAVVLKDMQLDHADQPALLDDINLLQLQVEACRNSLQQLSRKADFRNYQPETQPLQAFVRDLLSQWQLLRPEVFCSLTLQQGMAPQISVDLTLRQALINILNNAGDASPAGIELKVAWNEREWSLQVRDFGAGIMREIQEQLGRSIISTKPDGMGVGLVLSQATINRLGGKVSMFPLDGSGTLTEIVLPLLAVREPHYA
jgi:two-component system, sensor histidine kinase RegB